MSALDDPAFVRRQYATECGLEARIALYNETSGPFAGDVALAALAEIEPRRVLEVGCGTGWFSASVARELGAEVVAIDQSERMVELARTRGVDARVGDVQALAFADGEFDGVAANFMLYHVPDLDAALAEVARVLRAGGRFVASTVGRDHVLELWELIGLAEARVERPLSFAAENGADLLRRHFAGVEVRDASGTATIRERQTILGYLRSTESWARYADRLPGAIPLPLVVRRSNVVFVADKA